MDEDIQSLFDVALDGLVYQLIDCDKRVKEMMTNELVFINL